MSGRVCIACPPDVAEVIVAPLAPGLLAVHPQLRIEIDPGEHVVDLTRREADLVLGTVRPAQGDLVLNQLAAVAWMPVAAPRVARAARGAPLLGACPWGGLRGAALRHRPGAMARDARVGRGARRRTDSPMLRLALVRGGAGAALVPEPSARHYGLVPLRTSPALHETTGAWPSDDHFLVTHRALRRVPRVRVVWDALVDRASGPPGR